MYYTSMVFTAVFNYENNRFTFAKIHVSDDLSIERRLSDIYIFSWILLPIGQKNSFFDVIL